MASQIPGELDRVAERVYAQQHARAEFEWAVLMDGSEAGGVAVGSVDFVRRRYILERGDWNAAPGSPGDPLWLVDLARGITSASRETSAPDAWFQCRADLTEADRRSPAGLAVPGGYTVQSLREIPLRIALGPDGIMRAADVRFANWRSSVRFTFPAR
jgi:hypothetical protein